MFKEKKDSIFSRRRLFVETGSGVSFFLKVPRVSFKAFVVDGKIPFVQEANEEFGVLGVGVMDGEDSFFKLAVLDRR